MKFFTCLTPFISLTSSLKLTWLQFSHHLTSIPLMLTWPQFSHHLTSIRWTQCPSYCGIFFKCPWASWWLGAHDGCMVCSVPYFVVQAVSYCVIKHVTSGPVTIHLLSAAVTPNAPPSALTTAFACSRAWSINIGKNFRLVLCRITFQFRTSEPSEVVSVKSYCLCRGQDRCILCVIYIVFGK